MKCWQNTLELSFDYEHQFGILEQAVVSGCFQGRQKGPRSTAVPWMGGGADYCSPCRIGYVQYTVCSWKKDLYLILFSDFCPIKSKSSQVHFDCYFYNLADYNKIDGYAEILVHKCSFPLWIPEIDWLTLYLWDLSHMLTGYFWSQVITAQTDGCSFQIKVIKWLTNLISSFWLRDMKEFSLRKGEYNPDR